LGNNIKGLTDALSAGDRKAINGMKIDLVTQYGSLMMKTDSILFKASNESIQLLLKDPVNTMMNKATGADKAALEKAFLSIITHDEAVLRGAQRESARFESPQEVLKRTYESQKEFAVKEYEKLLDQVKDASLKMEIEWRLEDLKNSDFEKAWADAQRDTAEKTDTTTSRFTDVSGDVLASIINGKSSAQQVAEVLANLGQVILPVAGHTGIEVVRVKEKIDSLNVSAENQGKLQDILARKGWTYESKGETYLSKEGQSFIDAFAKMVSVKADDESFYTQLSNFFKIEQSANADNSAAAAGFAQACANSLGQTDSEKFSQVSGMAEYIVTNGYSLKAVQEIGQMLPLLEAANVALSKEDLQKIAEAEYSTELRYLASEKKIPALPSAVSLEMANTIVAKLAGATDAKSTAVKKALESVTKPYDALVAQIEGVQDTQGRISKMRMAAQNMHSNPVKKLGKATNITINSLVNQANTIAGTEAEATAKIDVADALSSLMPANITRADITEFVELQKSGSKLMDVLGKMSAREYVSFKNSSPQARIALVEKALHVTPQSSGIAADDLTRLVQAGLSPKEAIRVASPMLADQVTPEMKGDVQSTLQTIEQSVINQPGAAALQTLAQIRSLTRAFTPAERAREQMALPILRGLETVLAESSVEALTYLKTQGGNIINCAIQALTEIAQQKGTLTMPMITNMAVAAYLSDIISGKFEVQEGLSPRLSMQAIIDAAHSAGMGLEFKNISGNVESILDLKTDGKAPIVAHFANPDNPEETGHYVVITGVDKKKGTITYRDANGESNLAMTEDKGFVDAKGRTFTGALLVDEMNSSLASLPENIAYKTAAGAKGGSVETKIARDFVGAGSDIPAVLRVDNASSKAIRVWLEARKTLSNQVFGVMKPGEINAVLKYLPQICQSEQGLLQELGYPQGESEIKSTVVMASYGERYNEVMALVKEGKMTRDAADVQVAILQTIKDIALNPQALSAYNAMVKQDRISEADVASLGAIISKTDKNNRRVSDNVIISLGKISVGDEEIVVNSDTWDQIRNEINNKRDIGFVAGLLQKFGISVRSGERTLDGKLEFILGKDGFADGVLERSSRKQILSPLGAMRVAASA
jgi:hypothetical protein